MDPQDQGQHPEGLLGHPRESSGKEIPRKVLEASTPYSQVTWVQGLCPGPGRPQWAHLMVGFPLQALPASWV